jgi:hypothetical protein
LAPEADGGRLDRSLYTVSGPPDPPAGPANENTPATPDDRTVETSASTGPLASQARAAAAATRPTASSRFDGKRALRGVGTAALVGGITLLTWPCGSVTPGAGIDPSWTIGLSLALARGLVFGRQVVFTYGPLGLFVQPRAVTPATLAVGMIGALALEVTLVAIVLHLLRRLLPWPVAAVVALIGLSIVATPGGPALTDVAFGLVALALSQPPERARRAATALALAGGFFAGIALLVKLNDGIGSTLIVTVGLLGAVQRRRNLAIGAAALVATTLIAWLATGQPLAAFPDYVTNGIAIVEGYVDAMGLNTLGTVGEWQVVAIFLFALAVGWGAWSSLADRPVRSRAALCLCVLIFDYFVAREMFVRYDQPHAAEMALLAVVPLMVPWRRAQLQIGSAIVLAVALASLAALGDDGLGTGSAIDLGARSSALVTAIDTVFSPGPTIAAARSAIQAGDGVPATIASELDGHCVDVEPVEIAAVFAYPGWRWCPVGVIQSYSAYTPSLDRLDAAGFANARTGPDRVLRQMNETIDGRNPVWESPAAMLSLLCHFVELGRGGNWQALKRVPDRCGRPRVIGTVHSGPSDVAAIPPAPAGTVLIGEVRGLQIYLRERLQTLFLRARERSIVINGGDDYRVIADTVGDGLILDVPPDADYAPPFNLNLAVSSMQAQISLAPVPFSVRLLAVPIRPN